MKIDCYISEGCTSENALRKNIGTALELESASADIDYHRINEDEASKLGLMGSPTVLINGIDILPGDIPGIS